MTHAPFLLALALLTLPGAPTRIAQAPPKVVVLATACGYEVVLVDPASEATGSLSLG